MENHQPILPTKSRGVPRVDDRRVLNGIFWVLRSGAPWRDLPDQYGPYTTCYNRFVRWRRAGVWDRLTAELRGLAAKLDQAASLFLQRSSAWELGDSRCTVGLSATGRHGAGAVVRSSAPFTVSGLGSLATCVLTRGRLVWTLGAIALPADARPIAIGDTFTVTAGCHKTVATCRDRFFQVVSFGGVPQMPGNDFVLSYATKGSYLTGYGARLFSKRNWRSGRTNLSEARTRCRWWKAASAAFGIWSYG
jgi:transposase